MPGKCYGISGENTKKSTKNVFNAQKLCTGTPHLVLHRFVDKPLIILGVLQKAYLIRTHEVKQGAGCGKRNLINPNLILSLQDNLSHQ